MDQIFQHRTVPVIWFKSFFQQLRFAWEGYNIVWGTADLEENNFFQHVFNKFDVLNLVAREQSYTSDPIVKVDAFPT